MEQSELNSISQRWLESLVQLQKSSTSNEKQQFEPLTQKGLQDLSSVLETLASNMKITMPIKTSLHAGGTHLAVLARNLASYLSVALDIRDIDSIAGAVHAHVAQSILCLLGLNECDTVPKASMFHDDIRDGLVRVFQMALYKKYDKMATEGLLTTANKPPVVYIGARGEVSLMYHVCARVGIPASCIRIVPCSSSGHDIDVNELEKIINDDCNQGKTPTLIICYAGTPLAGHNDDFKSLRDICNRYKLWLHATGHGLSSLCIQSEHETLQDLCTADSFTFFPGTWFGILSCPMITVHRHPKIIQTNGLPTSANFPGDTELSAGEFPVPGIFWTGFYPHGLAKLLPLTIWVCLEYLGTSALIDTVSYCRSLTKNMLSYLEDIPGVTRLYPNQVSNIVLFKYNGAGQLSLPSSFKYLVVSHQQPSTPTTEHKHVVNGTTDEEKPDTEEDIKPDKNTSVDDDKVVDSADSADTIPPLQNLNDDEPVLVTIHGMPSALTNMYNLMLSSELKTHFPKLGLATYDMGDVDGVVFRFDPTVSFPEYSTSIEDIEKFIAEFKSKLEAIHPIAQARCLFEVSLRKCPNLRWMEFPNLHCVAVLQFVPSDWLNKQELVLEEVNELNKLNLEFCEHLTSFVPVFSPFQHGNFTCIIVKELAEGKTMFELLEVLMQEVKKFEEHKEYLKKMSNQIQEGIKAAENDLIKEKTKEEEDEGILKYVPIVGSVVGWLYPTSPTTRVGRTFNLSSGKVEDTSTVYQNKLQYVKEEDKHTDDVNKHTADDVKGDSSQPTAATETDPDISIETKTELGEEQ